MGYIINFTKRIFVNVNFDAFVIRAILTKTFDNEMIDMRNIMTCYKGT